MDLLSGPDSGRQIEHTLHSLGVSPSSDGGRGMYSWIGGGGGGGGGGERRKGRKVREGGREGGGLMHHYPYND